MENMVKMSLHEALVKMKHLDNKIDDLMEPGFFAAIQVGEGENKGVFSVNNRRNAGDLDEITKKIKARFDKLVAYLGNREKIKRALVQRNAEVLVEMGGKTMTIAEAIAMKHLLIKRKQFTKILSSDLINVSDIVENRNKSQEKMINDKILKIYEKPVDDLKDGQYKTIADEHWKENKSSVIDPLKLEDRIQTQKDQYEDFLEEFDTKIETANIMNSLEVDMS